mmetsp:Transcript_41580/g.104852  ORF Transcript_41580/g.104852 Transcript_41580/m.104852 type:complete len:773 (-) Transcript_41580:283-2601(-)|eukprot:CAMPEP_0177687808 /NCGR_PEP_ID=MMETSP0447-20121125/34333_1 /TAXON_ID=0 /ORGANISM="Stygamoeba regulata, Strain BSH-02190019" /LENGTH=772 /DNA_ID=CAMNT_0019198089 /DNA_START=239 /DNA_END=2557 /DNA_ORIENTATION=-
MQLKLTSLLVLLLASGLGLMLTMPRATEAQGLPVLRAIWFEWDPCFAFRDQLAPLFKEATIEVTCVPLGQWHDAIFRDDFLSNSSGKWDIVILDSQFIGEAVTGGHVIELTQLVADQIDLTDYFAEPFAAYGEYPPNSKRYFGVPFEADVQFLVYRKDIWEQIGVRDVFGYDDPDSDSGLLQVARRINAAPGVGAYGYASFWCTLCGDAYDQGATCWNQIAWSYGGEIWDPATFRVDGVLQQKANEDSLDLARQLILEGPPNVIDYDFGNLVGALCDGTVAMGAIWAGFGPAFTGEGCAMRDRLGFTVVPGQRTHALSLGGMGVHVSSHVSPERQQLAQRFVAWSQQQTVQRAWVEMGGYSARKSVLASGLFINSAAYAPIFGVSYPLVKDFWNLPEYAQLLQIQMQGLYGAFSGELSSAQALDQIAKGQQALLDEAYPDGPPRPPADPVTIIVGVQIALLVLTGLFMLLVVATMVAVFVKRHVAVFHFSSPIFMELILLGCLLLLSALLTYAQDPPNTVACQFHLWLSVLGVCLIFGPLLAKTWRVWQIYQKTSKFMSIRITNADCLKVTAGVMAPAVILLAVWTGVDTNRPKTYYDEPNDGEQVTRCDNDHLAIYLGVLFGYLGVLVLAGCVFAFLTRNVATEFNESRYLTVLLYNLVLISAVTIPLIFFISDDPTVSFALECAGFLFAVLLVLGVLFGPKFYRLAAGKGDDRSTLGTRGARGTTTSSGPNTSGRNNSSNNHNNHTSSNSDPPIRQEMDTVVSQIFDDSC